MSAVILFHYFGTHVPPGYLGTGVFFVIPGYGITSYLFGAQNIHFPSSCRPLTHGASNAWLRRLSHASSLPLSCLYSLRLVPAGGFCLWPMGIDRGDRDRFFSGIPLKPDYVDVLDDKRRYLMWDWNHLTESGAHKPPYNIPRVSNLRRSHS